ncbi:uncharacterized protein [Chelonus insularis]|nr:uncharacterized protein LOC118067313 isoform X2 [Chelonus insularis]XP_034939868.1 uncharacterized protein LOC118067313 isoform X2 [Chelonus insularis]
MSRIIITHLYTISYIANFYSIITWSQEKMLLPWLTMSAFKNFILESIVLFVIILLYLEGNLSGFLFSTAVFEKIITMALAAHNWNAINALYIKLKERDKKNDKRKNRLTTLSTPFNVMIGMSMQRSKLDEDAYKKRMILSLPDLNYLHTDSLADSDDKQTIKESKSLTAISSLKNHQFDSKRNSNITDDLQFSPVNKVLKVLDFTNNVTDEFSLSKYEFDDKFSDDSVSEVIHVIEHESDDVDSKTSTCVCLSDTGEKNVITSPEESFNIHPSRAKTYSKDNIEGNHSEWSRHWNLESMLRSYKSVEMKESETEYDIGITYDEKCCQWSSSEDELDDEINEQKKQEIQKECWQILNDLMTIVFLQIESKFKRDKNNIPKISMKNIETQTAKNNSYKTSTTQTSSNELPSSQYNSYYLHMLMDLSRKDNTRETIQDREKKELEALKVYNAMTLWKYKEEKDKMSLNTIEASTSDKFKINTSKKMADNSKTFESFRETFDDFQVGRKLDRSRASRNIPGLLLMNSSHNQLMSTKMDRNKMSIFEATDKNDSSIDKNISATRVVQSSKDLIDLKTKIFNIDWTFPLNNLGYSNRSKKINLESELLATDIIDEYDTIPLLQSAFSFDPHENVRGFYLGPASSDFYSISEQIPNVFHEIIKTARIEAMTYNLFNYPSTQEVDFGEDYLKNWKTIHENNKNELFNKDAKEVTNIHGCEDLTVIQDTNDTIINNRNNFLHVGREKKIHYFDDDDNDDSDWSNEAYSTGDYFSKYIKKQDSLSDFSNQSNMSEFQANDLISPSTSSQLIL